MLEPLGVDDATFAVYHALLSHPDSTPEQIAELVKQPIGQVLDTMALLRKLELLVPTWANPDVRARGPPPGRTVRAGRAPPQRAEPACSDELKQAEASAEVIAEQYNELLTSRTSGDVEVLKGRANASRRIEELA